MVTDGDLAAGGPTIVCYLGMQKKKEKVEREKADLQKQKEKAEREKAELQKALQVKDKVFRDKAKEMHNEVECLSRPSIKYFRKSISNLL